MKKHKSFISYNDKYLLAEIERSKKDLAAAYANFETVSDPTLVDCWIYEVNSAQMRYQFLLSQAKKADLSMRIFGEPLLQKVPDLTDVPKEDKLSSPCLTKKVSG